MRVADQAVTTGADGRFSITGAPLPYDLQLVADPSQAAYVYLGMSDLAPTFRVFEDVDPDHVTRQGKVHITLPSADTPTLGTAFLVEVAGSGLTWQASYKDSGAPQGPSQTWDAAWRGAAQAAVTVHTFQFQRAGLESGPQHYVGYDTLQITLADGDEVPWNVAWKAPPFGEKTVSASVSAPWASGEWSSSVVIQTTAGGFGVLADQPSSSPAASFVVPDLPGASFSVSMMVGDQNGSSTASFPGLAAGAAAPTLTIPSPPTQIAPTDATTTFGPGSTVAWKGGQGAASFTLTPWDPSSGPAIYVLGGDGSARIPDLSGVGVTLLHGSGYSAELTLGSSAVTVDDLARGGPYFAPADQPSTSWQGPRLDVKAP